MHKQTRNPIPFVMRWMPGFPCHHFSVCFTDSHVDIKIYKVWYLYPIGSMYGIFTYVWLIFMVNVGKNTVQDPMGTTHDQIYSCFGSLHTYPFHYPYHKLLPCSSISKKKRTGDVFQSCSGRTRIGWTWLWMQVPWCEQPQSWGSLELMEKSSTRWAPPIALNWVITPISRLFFTSVSHLCSAIYRGPMSLHL